MEWESLEIRQSREKFVMFSAFAGSTGDSKPMARNLAAAMWLPQAQVYRYLRRKKYPDLLAKVFRLYRNHL